MTRAPSPARLPWAALRGLLALALLWAGSLAPGVMPARAAGGLVIEICAEGGVVPVRVDAEGRAVPVGDGPADGDRHAPACAFAAHPAATPLRPLLWTLPDGTAMGLDAPLAAAPLPAPAPLPSDHPPRGPPTAA